MPPFETAGISYGPLSLPRNSILKGSTTRMKSQPTMFRGCSNWPHKLLHLIPPEMWTLPGWRSGSVGRMERRLEQELTDEATVAMLRTPWQTAEQESEGEEEEEQRHTWKHAQDCVATFLEFTQSSPYYNSSEVMAI